MYVDLIVHSASQVCVVPSHDGPQRGRALGDLGVIRDGAVAGFGGTDYRRWANGRYPSTVSHR